MHAVRDDSEILCSVEQAKCMSIVLGVRRLGCRETVS